MAAEQSGLTDVWDALRRRWLMAVIVALPVLGGVAVYVQSLPDEYDGTAIVAFAPASTTDPVGADVIRLTVPKYVAYLTSPATAERVAGPIGERAEVLESAVDATTAPDTPTLTVVVRLPDAERAARAANAFAEEAVRLSTTDQQLSGEVLSPALVPRAPAAPPRRLLLAGGVFLAVLTGLTAAVVADRSRPKVTDALSLAVATGHGVVGRIPRARGLRRNVLGGLDDSGVGTAVRAMRTQLEQQSRSAPVTVVAVTSPVSGDGKTTVAALLAGALARVDASVLLVDADMRRPRVGSVVGVSEGEGRGLGDVLDGAVPLGRAVRAVEDVPGLSVLVAEHREDAGDLIARRMNAVLASARESYDVVVLDCPPLLATDDARTLSLLADGTLLVVAAGRELGRVTEASSALDTLKVRVLGCVLNRSRASGRGDLGSYGTYGTARV